MLIQNGSEKKRVDAVTKKLQKANKKISRKKEVRVEQKENDIPVVAKGVPTPKGKPGKSVCILDKQIKENKQALLDLLEQARKCVETSKSSDNSEIEMPTCKLNEKKKRLSTKKCLKQTINKVCSKLDDKQNRCEARTKRKQHRGKKRKPKKDKRHQHDETDEEGEITSSSSSSSTSSSSSSDSSSTDGSFDDKKAMVTRARKGKKRDKKNKKKKAMPSIA